MRKIFFVSLICLTGLIARPVFIQAETLPKEIQEMVLKDIGFYEPVSKIFNFTLFSSTADSSHFYEKEAEMMGRGVKTCLWRDIFFIPYGYLFKQEFGRDKYGWANTKEYPEIWGGGVGDLVPTEKFKPYLRGLGNDEFTVILAKRVLKSIDYVNKWKLNNLDTWSFTFTYFMEPVLSELPRLGPFTGKGTAMFNPAMGNFGTVFEKDVGRQYGSSFFWGWNDATYTAWLERQGVGVSQPRTSQPPRQMPTPAETAPEKITIDWLTRNLPYGEYNAGRFQAIEKTYNVSFDDAWTAVNIFLLEAGYGIVTSDLNKGVLIGQKEESRFNYWTAAIIERITEYSVKIAIKQIAYGEGAINSFSDIIHKNLEKKLKSKIKQPPYLVVIEGKQYKVSGDIFTGKKEGRVFKDEKGAVMRDPVLAKKIAQAAWVYENVVKAPGLSGSKRVSAILETHKRLRQYELTQGILARASVQVLAATMSGGATLTYTVPAGLTWRVVREQFLNLKGLLSLTGRQGLEEALSKYQQIESSIANLKPNSIDEVTAVEIRRLHEPAHGLELSCGVLLTSLMPKRGRQLLEKALKDIGDELVRTLPLSDEVLTTREVLDLQGKMDDALKSNPALKEYYEKLDLAKRLKEANEQVITAWAEQAVQYKE